MGDIVEVASNILAQSERRLANAAQNLANISTPGYKRRLCFDVYLSGGPAGAALASSTDFTAGKRVDTGNPFDLAIAGDGFFAVRGPSGISYTRAGQFRRDADGRLVTPDGLALQLDSGDDVILRGDSFTVTDDAVVIEDGRPIGKLAIMDAADRRSARATEGGAFVIDRAQMVEIGSPSVRQGSFEASNVSTGDEMVSIMEALRRAEGGQRLVGVYDDLMGRALGAFGQV